MFYVIACFELGSLAMPIRGRRNGHFLAANVLPVLGILQDVGIGDS
jgi:hypothetical protein